MEVIRKSFFRLSRWRIDPIRKLVKAKDVATKLGVSISWVVQHASRKANPICRPSKWVLAEVPCASTPTMWKGLSKSTDVSLDNAQDTQTGENFRRPAMDIRATPIKERGKAKPQAISQNSRERARLSGDRVRMCFRASTLRSDAHTVSPVVIGLRCVRLRFTMAKIVTVNLVSRLLCKSASRHRSTHDFVVQGCGLGHLFTELAAQRVTVLKQPIRADRFEAASANSPVQITSIEVHVVQKEA
jgi:hypothetical protein